MSIQFHHFNKKAPPKGALEQGRGLHGDVDHDPGLELKGQVLIIDRHPTKKFSDEIFIVLLNSRLLAFQKAINFIETPLQTRVVSILQEKSLLRIP